MIKSLKKNDIRTTPFTAAKKWNPQNKLHKDLILWQSGSVSGSLSLTFKEYNDGTVAPYTYISSAIALQQQQDDFLRFREGVNLSGSISPTGSFYYDPVLSEKNVDGTYKTVLYATTKHLFYKESQDPSKIFGLESLDSSNVNRSLPNKISTFNIPQNKFGEKVIPKSVVITHEIQGQTYNVVDDGNSNLVVSDKTFINNQDANIDKVPANIILNGLPKNPHSEQYDGNPYVITVTTKPLNLAYIVTYNGSTTPPTNAGTYTVVAMIDDNFYAASKTSTFIIEKAPRVINISNVNQTYDGNPKPVTVSIPSVNVNYTVTYNGSTTPPTNAGTYAVVVTINDINNENFPEKDSNGQPNLGSGRDTLKILPQTPTITAQCPSKTYGDADFTIPVNTVSNGAISYTINSGLAKIVNDKIRITGVGNLNVTITQAASGNYSAASVICSSITVSPKPLTVTGITAADKVQDATTNATVNTTNAVLQGIIPTPNGNGTLDVVTLSGTAVGTFSDANVGEGKTVTIISGLALSGLGAPNYNLVPPTATAAIKANTASGTITMTSAIVTYNSNPQPLGVSITPNNIPIKITYPNGRVDRLLLNAITKLSGPDYPKDIGKYTVTAELDVSIPNNTTIYTVSTVTATLEIKPIEGKVTFGPNIFYYDDKQQQLQILSKTPPDKNLIITYNGSTTVPSAIGSYTVNVKFEDPNIFYNNTVTLSIKSIPTSTAPQTISKESDSPQDQKNIINLALANAVGNVNFSYNLVPGMRRFTIEYPLNSGTLVHDSDKITVNNTSNVNMSFTKKTIGITQNGIDSEKCLITVYSNNNSWTYTISAVNASTSVLPTVTVTGIVNIGYIYEPTKEGEKYAGSNLGYLKDILKSIHVGTSNPINKKEFEAINNIIEKNKAKDFNSSRSVVLLDTDITGKPNTNIKIIVNYLTAPAPSNQVLINLQYKRLNNSLGDAIVSGDSVIDYHYYKYMGVQTTFDQEDAIKQLNAQIYSDTFLNNTKVPNMQSTGQNLYKGEIQRSLLINFVAAVIQNTSINNARFKFELGLSPLPDQGTVTIFDTTPPTVYKIRIPNAYLDTTVEGCISISKTPNLHEIEIIYPFDWSIKK